MDVDNLINIFRSKRIDKEKDINVDPLLRSLLDEFLVEGSVSSQLALFEKYKDIHGILEPIRKEVVEEKRKIGVSALFPFLAKGLEKIEPCSDLGEMLI